MSRRLLSGHRLATQSGLLSMVCQSTNCTSCCTTVRCFQSRPPAAASLHIPSVAFTAPQSMTHEHLAYAKCPVCRQSVHMVDMYLHLTSRHKELNPKHCNRLCEDRLALYERSIGVKLQKIEIDTDNTVLDCLPTLVEGGGYLCNWCTTKNDFVWPTRDAFLGHVAKAHAHIDIEDIEAHVAHNNQVISRSPLKAAPTTDAKGPRRRFTHTIATVPDYAISSAPPAPVAATFRVQNAANVSVPNKTQNKSSTEFREDNFPCELCGRCYQTEGDLLKHLETSHPLGVLDPATDGGPGTHNERLALDDVRRMQQMDMNTADIAAVCDLCTKQITFTRRSGLFAHLRVKHPNVDAVAAMERIVRNSELRRTATVTCPECKKLFASQLAMESHFNEKHPKAAPPVTMTTSSSAAKSTASTLRPTLLSSSWWCNDCERGFASAKALHGHLSTKHGVPTQVFPCPACKRVFVDIYSLKEHVTLSHKSVDVSDIKGEVHAPCEQCGRNFTSHRALHDHEVKHHGKDPATFQDPTQPSSSPPSSAVADAVPTPRAVGNVKGPRVVAKRKVVAEEIQADDVTFA